MTDEAFFRGHAYLSYVEPLAEERPALWRALVAGLPPASAAFVREPIFADQWYPRLHLHGIVDRFDRLSGGDDRELRELGAMGARFQLGAIYRALLASSPSLVLRRAGAIWRRQSSAGELRLLDADDAGARLELADPELPPRMPIVLAGWTEAVVRLLGGTPYPTSVEPAGPGAWHLGVRWLPG